MNLNTLTHHGTTAHGRLRVFALYLDFPASIRSRWANSTVSQLAGQNWITSAEMWKLDALATSAPIRNMITGEAAKADVLFVAVSSLSYRHHELIRWLETLATCVTDRQNPGLLIGLFGDDDEHNSELNWIVKQCLHCAGQMNRDFIWRWMETGAMSDYSWLKGNLETFLARKRTVTEKALLSGLPALSPPRLSALAR